MHLERADAGATAPPQHEEDGADLLEGQALLLDIHDLLLEGLAAEMEHEQEDEREEDPARADGDRVGSVPVGLTEGGPGADVHEATRRRSHPDAADELCDQAAGEAGGVEANLDLTIVQRVVDLLGHR